MYSESQLSNGEVASLLYHRVLHLRGLLEPISLFAGRTVTLAELASSGVTADLGATNSEQLTDVAGMLDRDGVTASTPTNEARWKIAKALKKMLGHAHIIPLGCQPHLHTWGQEEL
jgi:hypothetical protein